MWREAEMPYLLSRKMPGGTIDNEHNTSIRSTMSSPSYTKKNRWLFNHVFRYCGVIARTAFCTSQNTGLVSKFLGVFYAIFSCCVALYPFLPSQWTPITLLCVQKPAPLFSMGLWCGWREFNNVVSSGLLVRYWGGVSFTGYWHPFSVYCVPFHGPHD
jgi:hypothetical protein